MADVDRQNTNSSIKEVNKKIRLLTTVVSFIFVSLFAMVLRYTFKSFIPDLDLLSDAAVNLIVILLLSLFMAGLYLALMLSRQVSRIINDYNSRIENMLHITKDLREEVYGDILLEKIMDYALSVTDSEAGSLLLIDNHELVFKIVRGEKSSHIIGASVEKGKGIAGWVAETGLPLCIEDARKDERFEAAFDDVSGFSTQSILCVPMKTKSKIIGVIELLNRKDRTPYRKRDEEIISYLAEQAAISIIKTKFFEDQKNYEIHLTDMLLEAIDFHIEEKKGHSQRVAHYSNIISKGLNMPEDGRKRLYFAALLHDVGFLKIVSEDSFRKEEYRKHPKIGYDMIQPINFYSDIALFILYHHERYDGFGYPAQIKGEDIPLESRIIAIAEAFDAMISTQSYRIPIGFDDALDELRHNAGTQFDPHLVKIFAESVEPRHTQE